MQSKNQWSGGIVTHPATSPQNFGGQKTFGKFLPQFLGIKRASPQLLSTKIPNYQRRVLLISAGTIEGHFEGRKLREIQQGCLVLV